MRAKRLGKPPQNCRQLPTVIRTGTSRASYSCEIRLVFDVNQENAREKQYLRYTAFKYLH
jgi:hypothetical protein